MQCSAMSMIYSFKTNHNIKLRVLYSLLEPCRDGKELFLPYFLVLYTYSRYLCTVVLLVDRLRQQLDPPDD